MTKAELARVTAISQEAVALRHELAVVQHKLSDAQSELNRRDKLASLKGSCWCSDQWRATQPRNHQDKCVAKYNRRVRALLAGRG